MRRQTDGRGAAPGRRRRDRGVACSWIAEASSGCNRKEKDMAVYELTGTVKVVMDVVKFESGFSKREFVVTAADDQYPQEIKFECVKDRCALLDEVKPGQRVKVSFDLRGNEYKGRYYVNLSAWRVEAMKEEPGPDSSEDGPPLDQLTPPGDEGAEEMPF
jgi:single-strand DNA-binding protein